MKYIEGNVKRHQKKWNNLCFESGSLRISKRQSDWRKVSRVLATWYSVLVSNIWWKHETAYWHCFCFTSVRQGLFVMIRRQQMTNRGSTFFLIYDKSIFGESCFHSLAAEWYDVRLVVALVKQGSALLARGWMDGCCHKHYLWGSRHQTSWLLLNMANHSTTNRFQK